MVSPTFGQLLSHVDQESCAPIIHHQLETHECIVHITMGGQIWPSASFYVSDHKKDYT